MSQALYRKYRPQTFSEVIGQPHIKKTLLNQIKGNKFAHAYLFCGPRGIGKTTLARLVAKSVNCLELKEGEPCNKCEVCVSINSNKALDIIEIDAASHTGVDNVRENIINNANVAPSILKNKIFIIDEVHMLSLSAFNALLKTLEEPPANIVFILATTEIHKVPATIISRCQRFDFTKVSLKEITAKLERIVAAENIKVDLEVLERIARNSEGCARDAESLLGQVIALDDNHITADLAELVIPKTQVKSIIDLFYLLIDGKSKEAIAHVNSLVEDGVDLVEFNKNFIEFLRKILLYRITGKLSELEYLDIDKETHAQIVKYLKKTKVGTIVKLIDIFCDKAEQIKTSSIVQLPLELAIIEICEPEEIEVKEFIAPKKKAPEPVAKEPKITETPLFSNGNDHKPSKASQEKTEEDNDALELVKQKMPTIVKALREKNHALALTFSIAQLVMFDKNNTLTLGVKYKFHSDRICEPDNLKDIESTLEKELERPVKVVCAVDDKYETKNLATSSSNSDNLDNLSEDDAANVWDMAVNTFSSEEPEQEK